MLAENWVQNALIKNQLGEQIFELFGSLEK